MKFTPFLLRSLGVSVLLSSTANAYVDGGTALLLLQGFFAAIGAVLVFFRKPWQRIAKIFSRKRNTPSIDA